MYSGNRTRRPRGRKNGNKKNNENVLVRLDRRERMLEVPPLMAPLRFSSSIRYQPATAVSASVYAGSILNLIVMTKTTTTAQSCIEAARLKRLHIWVPAFTQTTAAAVVAPSCRLSVRDFIVPGLGVERELIVNSQVGKGGYLCYTFKGIWSQWFNSFAVGAVTAAEQLFQIIPTGCIPLVQLDFDWQLPITTTATIITISTTVDITTAGFVAYPALDNLIDNDTEGAANYPPVQLQTVTVNMPRPSPTLGAVSSSSAVAPRSCSCLSCQK